MTSGADPAIVGPYLAAALGDDAWRDVTVSLIAGGKSNLTYRLDSPAGSVVLRRPPLGHVLATAHDMVREHTVMAGLAGTAVPVPTMLHLCTDTEVLGQPFYVMERVEGHIVKEAFPAGYADEPAQRRAVCEGLIGVLNRLHDVDQDAVGLGSFGRPDGYMERQVRRWVTQWEATRVEGQEALDTLAQELAAQRPQTQRNAIVHGDYRLDNTMLHPTQPGEVVAVLDWEMSTLGDPLADLGILLVYWGEGNESGLRSKGVIVPQVTGLEGCPTRAEVVELYGRGSGLDVSALPWYVAFGFFKLAVVCAGIAMRSKAGAMEGEGFEGYDAVIAPLVELGRATLADQVVH